MNIEISTGKKKYKNQYPKIHAKDNNNNNNRPQLHSVSVILTYIGGAFGYWQVGADAPGPALVMSLTAAAVGPRGVVLTLTAQPALVVHTGVGVEVALAPKMDGWAGGVE